MIAMVKAHTPINWENEPSYNTPLNAANLNKMDSEIGILDDRIIEQDTIKLDKTTANTMVKAISFDENTGVFTITLLNGSTTKIDTKLEKVVVNFSYDATTQQIIINLVDGTTQYIDLSALITQYEFVDSDTIAWEVTTDGKVKAKILDGSITENMLQPNYLAEIKVESAKAEANAIKSQSYAVGGTNSRENEEIDNAKYYYEQSKSISESFSGALVPMGTVAFEDLPSLEDAVGGWMYNISNEFTTTDDFKEGAGHVIPLGANVFKTFDGFWDVLAGSPVTGVKGNAETSYRRGNVNITKANIGLGNVDNTSDVDKPISTAMQTALDNKVDKVNGMGLSTNDYTTTEKNKLSGIATGAEVNQNAFSHVKVGDTTISADAKTDTLTLVSGDNVTITPDATNDKITIKATDTTYSNFVKSGSSAKAGLVPAPSTTAGTTKYLREDGTWTVPPDTTYTSLKNPYSLTIQGNGTTLTNGTYDGSAAKTVNITPSSIGALGTGGDSKSNTVTFTSNDVADGSATSWTSVSALASGITHATFFARVSQMFKNVRYLYKMLGTTDISAIGDGTVKGAISTLNSNLSKTNEYLVRRAVCGKKTNGSYAVLAASELGLQNTNVSVVNVNIGRLSATGYHFVTGFGWENSNLFVYFDGEIDTSVFVDFIVDYYVIYF